MISFRYSPSPRSDTAPPSPSPFLRRLLGVAQKVAVGAVLTAFLGLAAMMLVPAAFGYQRYVITSGSMSGTYDRGSLIYDEIVPVSALRVGDVITFTPPPGSGPKGRVTHRIFAIGSDRAGTRVFRTKGDANSSPDPWKISLTGTKQARVAAHVPYVGFAFAALAVKQVRMVVIGVPALLIAFSLLAGMWREATEEARRTRAERLAGGAKAAAR